MKKVTLWKYYTRIYKIAVMAGTFTSIKMYKGVVANNVNTCIVEYYASYYSSYYKDITI